MPNFQKISVISTVPIRSRTAYIAKARVFRSVPIRAALSLLYSIVLYVFGRHDPECLAKIEWLSSVCHTVSSDDIP